MEYKVLSAEQYYVDKTEVLERELKKFSSVYIEGAAASGKTTAVKMLLSRHEGVVSEVCWMDKEIESPQLFVKKLETIRTRMDEECIWVILENMPHILPDEMTEKIIWLISSLPESGRVILIGREQMEEKFLALLWKQKLELLPQKVLLFTKEEVKDFAEQMGCAQNADEIYKISGGWAGCVGLFLRFLIKDQEKEACNVRTLRHSYEIDHYIRREIVDTLLPEEKKILQYACICPWLNESLCVDVLGIAHASEWLKRLEKKGILLFSDRKKRWRAAPLFEGEVYLENPKLFWTELGRWYEAQSCIEDALYCLKQSGDVMAYRACVVKHYSEIPVCSVLHTDVMNWADDSLQSCYLRGVYSYCVRNFSRLQKEMRYVGQSTDDMAEEIYLNLAYMNPELSLDEWLELLEKHTRQKGPARLYHILGDSCSFLCGIRDLSGMFNGRHQEVKRKADIWRRCLGEDEWRCYLLAQAEYQLETEHKAELDMEAFRLAFEENNKVDRYIYRARVHFLCRLWQIYPFDSVDKMLKNQLEDLQWVADQSCEESVGALLDLLNLWQGQQNVLNRWRNLSRKDSFVDVHGENWIIWWCRAKGYLYLNRYEKAEAILQKLILYFQDYRRTYFLGESLFMMAVVKWKKGDKNQGLRYGIESFLITGDYRYVTFYTRCGQAGVEVLEAYISLMHNHEPERWNRKKKYKYGSVLRMPFADYLEVVLRTAKKIRKSYPDIESDVLEESLTMMERIVLQDISQGMTNAEICKELNLKLPTVKGHLYSLYKKLGVNSRVQAIVKAKEQGILK